MKRIGAGLLLLITLYTIITFETGCAQIGSPTGGPVDTTAPVLISETPQNGSTNFTGSRIRLNFDEYIEVLDITNNVLVSPVQKRNPTITYNFKEVNIRMRDTLLPNTTYTINFGSAIKDLNEGNPLQDYTYTFSTGPYIDSMTLSGKVILAETGNTDSTLIVSLYRNATDSTVRKEKPLYIAKVRGDGTFRFTNLPSGTFNVYALKDGDGGRTYNSRTEQFAFLDEPVTVSPETDSVFLYAYAEIKDTKTPTATKPEKTLKYTPSGANQDILSPFKITFNNSIKTFDETRVILTDTNYRKINTQYSFDSTRKDLSITAPWQPATEYFLLLPKDAITDSANNTLPDTDTFRFFTRRTEDYGTLVMRFRNLDLSRNPVLQFVINENVVYSYPLNVAEWRSTMFNPGEYDIRILYDDNNNGIWDPGNFSLKRQPEKAITLSQKLTVRPNWDNERDIIL